MQVSQRRQRVRDHFAGSKCVRPASIFDPVSSRIAYGLGFPFGMLGGSIASHTVLGAPDLAVITLTELAEQCRRITRASDISLLVDADHGYGNALSVMRTVDELETAGVAAMTIEDTVLPQRFGYQGQEELIPLNEMVGKLKAAVAARQDRATVIIGRTHSLNASNQADALERVKAFDATGVDAIFLLGVKEIHQLEAVRKVTSLPFMLGNVAEALGDETLAQYGVKMALRGHGTFNATVKAIYDSLKHQAEGGAPSEVVDTQADTDLISIAIGSTSYKDSRDAYLSE